MKILWTESAISQLTDIYEFIAKDSPQYALRMVDRITARSKQIQLFPELSQVVPEYNRDDIREMIEGPYRVIYRTESGRAIVLAVIHGARLLPATLPQSDV